jgi:hypothetical protein
MVDLVLQILMGALEGVFDCTLFLKGAYCMFCALWMFIVDYSTIVCINCSNTTRTCIIQFAAELRILIRSCGTTYLLPLLQRSAARELFSKVYIYKLAREILSTRVLWASRLMSRNLKTCSSSSSKIHSSTKFCQDQQQLLIIRSCYIHDKNRII